MAHRELPARPDLDHLKREAKALRRAFLEGDPAAEERVEAIVGPKAELKLTEAQRAVAREYGFSSWVKLREHVQSARRSGDALESFLAAVERHDRAAASRVLESEPGLASSSLHVASILGLETEVERLIARDDGGVRALAGATWPAEPLLWLCFSPFHGESPARDRGLLASARALLTAGADPNVREARHGVSALYGVTGLSHAPEIARLLLEAGAEPNDGESVFHAAERFHEEALELLLSHGADLNATGDWGNTPLYFLQRYWDVARERRVEQGLRWLLAHGADPNVLCDREERESSLHVAVHRGQHPDVVGLLLRHGADVHARRGDGRTAWTLAQRGGFGELVALLESAGARPEPLSAVDRLLEACGRGDADAARRLAVPAVVSGLRPGEARLIVQAATEGRLEVVRACLAAGFPVDTADETGATALHHAAIQGRGSIVRKLLGHGADHSIRDDEHSSTALGWACFGVDFVRNETGDYAGAVEALLEAGAVVSKEEHRARDASVRQLLDG